jgi:proteic killer suppression protein
MISSFGHKGLKRLYEKGDKSGIRPDMVRRVQDILTLLETIEDVDELNAPTLRLHPLTGDMRGYWSITVRANWRIIFRFNNGNAYDVTLIDYH